jgi:dTDP-4-dehydrorhamnose reductase
MLARAARVVCSDAGDEVFAWTRAELDIADGEACRAAINDVVPDAVLNCAAYTDVDGAESNSELAYSANASGPENLAIACREAGAHLVTISTDYVFDGENPGFYVETDEPRPLGIYGESKLEGERLTALANPAAAIVRAGWIYGSGGTNFLSVMAGLLASGKAITAINDQYGTPTFAVDLARAMREIVPRRISGIVHIANSGEGASYYGFAREVCEIGGFDQGLVAAVSYRDLKRPASRPVSSKLGSIRSNEKGLPPMDDWREALHRYLNLG